MLTPDPEQRPTAAQLLHHPWLAAAAPATAISTSIMHQLQLFAGLSRARRVMLGVAARNINGSEASRLLKAFLAVDKDFNGTLEFAELASAAKQVGADVCSGHRQRQPIRFKGGGRKYVQWAEAVAAKQVDADASHQHPRLDGWMGGWGGVGAVPSSMSEGGIKAVTSYTDKIVEVAQSVFGSTSMHTTVRGACCVFGYVQAVSDPPGSITRAAMFDMSEKGNSVRVHASLSIDMHCSVLHCSVLHCSVLHCDHAGISQPHGC
jgi:hypothetical protein